ncbi:DUF6056 family protein [Clostridiisalibacter paucivorans]|uniref:DUF6056 family protein n=1 Tax=Clostridiisalibacter paucivorans TaxID=408753 RepID=UPI00047D64D3|nr:DUF6056 family protein [Clostridiisalibacter paucivorans]
MLKSLQNKRKFLHNILILFIFVGVLLVSMYVRLYGDDFFYLRFTRRGINYFIERNIEHYFLANGRVIVHLLATIFLAFPIYIWQIFNSLMVTGVAFIASKLICIGEKGEYQNKKLITIVIFGIMIIFFDPNMSRQSIYWITGSFNYIYPLLLLFFYWYSILKVVHKKNISKYLPLIAFFSTASVEQGGMMAFGLTLMIILEKKYIQKTKVERVLWYSLFSSILGLVSIIASPSLFYRAGMENSPGNGLFDLIIYNIKMQSFTVFFSNVTKPYIIASILGAITILIEYYKICLARKKKNVLFIIVLGIMSIFLWLYVINNNDIVFNYNGTSNRLVMLCFFIDIIYLIVLFYSAYIVYMYKLIKNRLILLISLILGFGSQFMMVVSPVYGPRNLIFLNFMLVLFISAVFSNYKNIFSINAIAICLSIIYKSKFLLIVLLIVLLIFLLYLLKINTIKKINRLTWIKWISVVIIIFIGLKSVYYPTFNGYFTNSKVYDRNISICDKYKQKDYTELKQIKLPLELYGWVMPYHNLYYNPYYKLYLGLDDDVEIKWEIE